MVRARSLRLLLAWLVLVTGLVGSARGALRLGCKHQAQPGPGERMRAAAVLGGQAAVAPAPGEVRDTPPGESHAPHLPADAPALTAACTPAPALPAASASLAPPTPAGTDVAPSPAQPHASFVPPPLFRPPRVSRDAA